MPSVLITGASRGLGLEFARQYAADGWRVFACARDPETPELRKIGGQVSRHRLDVCNGGDLSALKSELNGKSVDVLINNAGVYGQPRGRGGWGDINDEAWAQTMRVNVTAPIRVTDALIGNVEKSERKTLVYISSRMGSIAENPGGSYVYRSSKAALNSAVKGLSADLKAKGIIAVVFHPGWVRTDMGGPNATLSPTQSITGMRNVILGLTPNDTGRFINYDGTAIPW